MSIWNGYCWMLFGTNPVDYELTADVESEAQRTDKYHRDHYTPEPHYRRDN